MSRRSGEAAVKINLANGCQRMDFVMVRHANRALAQQAAHAFEIAIRYCQVGGMFAIGRRIKDFASFTDSQAPGVIRGGAEKFQLRAVGLEAENPLAELVELASNLAAEAGIADRGVSPIVQPQPQVARAGMGVAGVEAAEQNLADI